MYHLATGQMSFASHSSLPQMISCLAYSSSLLRPLVELERQRFSCHSQELPVYVALAYLNRFPFLITFGHFANSANVKGSEIHQRMERISSQLKDWSRDLNANPQRKQTIAAKSVKLNTNSVEDRESMGNLDRLESESIGAPSSFGPSSVGGPSQGALTADQAALRAKGIELMENIIHSARPA